MSHFHRNSSRIDITLEGFRIFWRRVSEHTPRAVQRRTGRHWRRRRLSMLTFKCPPHQRPMAYASLEHLGLIQRSVLILWFSQLFGFAIAASIQFTIASGPCSATGVINECDNSDIGGTCASAPDANKEWCCEPEIP